MDDDWDPEDVGFFYPDMPLSWGRDEILNDDYASYSTNYSTYYRTAYSFVRRLRSRSDISPHTLCENLPSCFKGKAHTWWLSQNSIIRRGLTFSGDIEQWCQFLLKAFELSPDETFTAFNAVRYTVQDAINHRPPVRYIYLLRSAAEQCHLPPLDMTSWAWQHLEYPIRRLIPKPRKGVTLDGFGNVLVDNISREFWNKNPRHPINRPVQKLLFRQSLPLSFRSPFLKPLLHLLLCLS